MKEQWGRLTDDELDRLSDRRDQLSGKIQESYGYERDRAEREVDGRATLVMSCVADNKVRPIAGAGGATGGLIGGLIGAGIPEVDAKRYAGRLREGGYLISVHCDDRE